jgi:U5 snRNP spliceosome subunit
VSTSAHPGAETVRWSGQPPAPPPPPGPGVQPPFVAPPADGTSRRRWIAVGLSTGAVLLACIAGIASLGGVVYLGYQALREQAQGTVTDYLTALRDQEYGQAYELLCDSIQASTSPQAFERANREGPGIRSFDVGEPALAEDIVVPATIRYTNSTTRTVRFLMFQDTTTGALEVCGEAD